MNYNSGYILNMMVKRGTLMHVKALKKRAAFFKTNPMVIGLLFVLPIFVGVLTICFSQSTYTVFPAEDIGNRISGITDSIWKGNSKIKAFAYDQDTMTLQYILKEGAPSPMVFVTIRLGSAEYPLDLSHFDSVTFKITEATTKRVTVFIKTFVPGVSLPDPKDAQTLRHNQYVLQLTPGCHQYKVKLKDFITPPWWFEKLKVNQALLPKESYQKVITFDIQLNQEGSDYRLNKLETIKIEKIVFHREPSLVSSLILALTLLYFVGLGWYFIRKKAGIHPETLPQRKSLDLRSYRETELEQVKAFVEANYHIPDISTQMVAETVGIPSSRVFELVKEEYQLTFKQLINKMRIDEAKRLLRETDLRVTEIALNLGFNNVSYFNSLFKTYEGVTPSEYREGD